MASFYKSEKCFRRYEPAILLAVQNFPHEISFAPEGGRAISTEEARCRDAITSWLKERWSTSPDVDPEKVAKLRVYSDGTCVMISGDRSLGRAMRSLRNLSDGPIQPVVSPIPEPEPEPVEEFVDIEDAVELIDKGERTKPAEYELTEENLSRVVKAVEGRMNVAYYVKDEKINIF